MLVINERTTAPRSEQRVLNWMRGWTGQYVIVGLAISGCYLPDREREDETQEADLVVITPRAAIVVEVKGTVAEALSGILTVRANGRWRLSGFEGDPIHVREQDRSPFDQVTNNVFNLKELVRKHQADAYVDGLIVVVPPRESTVTLNVESRRKGCGVVLGNTPGELRAWFHRTASRKLIWTAERVHALLGDLNIADQVSVEDLVADGFPSRGEAGAVVFEGAPSFGSATSEEGSAADDVSSDTDILQAHSTVGLEPDARRAEVPGVWRPTHDNQPDVVRTESELGDSQSTSPPVSEDARQDGAIAPDQATSPAATDARALRSEPVATVDPGQESRLHAHGLPPSIVDRPSFVDRQSIDVADESESGEAEPISRPDGPPAASIQTHGGEPEPSTPQPYASGPIAPEPLPSVATPDFAAAPSLSSPFADQWSSWIESDAQPSRPRSTPSPLPNRPRSWSGDETEAHPPRRPTAPRVVARRPRFADLRQTIAVPARTRETEQLRPPRHRPQQIAAVALIALVIGTIWLLAAACSTPHGDAVHQTPLHSSTTEPPSSTEVVPPPPTVTQTPARFDLLPLCLPFRSDC
ncbi:NERD domain-containing protein [Nocardia sp. R6R-6]|uniref:NERD domain-containing protein n=1 Tax=Nocardia sp. R6R-6 TaxID=3459303 RepID=UPI00403D6701